jgi:hypothetical protein
MNRDGEITLEIFKVIGYGHCALWDTCALFGDTLRDLTGVGASN